MRVENRARLPEKGKSHEALAEHGATKAQTPQLNTALTLVVYRPRARAPHTMDNALVRHQQFAIQHAGGRANDRMYGEKQQTTRLWVVSFLRLLSKRAMVPDQPANSATLTHAKSPVLDSIWRKISREPHVLFCLWRPCGSMCQEDKAAPEMSFPLSSASGNVRRMRHSIPVTSATQ